MRPGRTGVPAEVGQRYCVHRHRFESIQHASRVIGDCISFYNNRRPHQALAMRTPAEAFR
ncbi:integrase core domain-containing protein [Pseudooceanicola spongiae]|uniref:Transposase n=1 Tax=Pseudooceanicola spongiae TaxID=2613965 RepID=A0A7L9WQD7_9RHOB|nr:transposase [Pseudooceanicola spongiae]